MVATIAIALFTAFLPVLPGFLAFQVGSVHPGDHFPVAGARIPPGPFFAAPTVTGSTVSVERETYLMGSPLRVRVEAPDRPAGLAAIERAFSEVRRLDGLLSTWSPESELARLNATPVGEAFVASPDLVGLLGEADRWRGETAGAFDPGVGALVDAWDMRGAGRLPSEAALERARAASGLALFEMDGAAGTTRRTREGSWIDSGGFGKGAALRSAAAALRDAGVHAGFLDFGGQVLALGAPAGSPAWPVPVAHPARRGEPAALLSFSRASASTSGQSERFVEIGGKRLGHILDPRSGRPAPVWGSVTVVAKDPLAADALSTGLFVLGPGKALEWAEARPDVGVLVLVQVGEELAAAWNDAMAENGLVLAPGVRSLEHRAAERVPDQPAEKER